MRRVTKQVLAGATGLVLCASPSMAQSGEKKLAEARQRLAQVERALAVIEKRQVIDVEATVAFDGGLYGYAGLAREAYDAVVADVDLAARSEGREGSVEFLPRFESELDADAGRLHRVQERVRAIQAGVQKGSIVLDATTLGAMSEEDLAAFASFLAPEALDHYRKAYPDLPFPEYSFFTRAFPNGLGAVARDVYERACAIPSRIGEALVPTTHAAIAWPCVLPCYKMQWAQCGVCVGTAIPGGLEAWNAFLACWNGSGKPAWVWTWLWKTGCVLTLVARLA